MILQLIWEVKYFRPHFKIAFYGYLYMCTYRRLIFDIISMPAVLVLVEQDNSKMNAYGIFERYGYNP